MGETLKKVWNRFTWALVALAVLLAVLLVGVRLFGLQVYAVLSSSMEPAYHTGSVIYVRNTPPDELEAGDVITFRLTGDSVATHRIVEVIGEGEQVRFRTKGDANDTADGGYIPAENVVGKVVFTLPFLGYAAELIHTPRGRYAAIAVGAFLLLMLIVPEVLFGGSKAEKKGR